MAGIESAVTGCGLPADQLLAYADGELPTVARALVDDHLRSCPACRRRLSASQGIGRMLRAATPPRDDPVGRAAIHARLSAPAGEARGGWWGWPSLVAVAVPLVLLLGIVLNDRVRGWADGLCLGCEPNDGSVVGRVVHDRSGAWWTAASFAAREAAAEREDSAAAATGGGDAAYRRAASAYARQGVTSPGQPTSGGCRFLAGWPDPVCDGLAALGVPGAHAPGYPTLRRPGQPAPIPVPAGIPYR